MLTFVRSGVLALVSFLYAQAATAQERLTVQEAIAVAMDFDGIELSDASRLTELKLAQWADGKQQWNIFIFDEGQEHIFEIQPSGDVNHLTRDDPRSSNDAFWAEMPEIEDVTDPYLYLERAISDLAVFDAKLTPRDKFLIDFKVCDLPFPGQQAEPSGCESGAALNNWNIVLQADRSFFRTATKMITYRDGQLYSIDDIEVDDSW